MLPKRERFKPGTKRKAMGVPISHIPSQLSYDILKLTSNPCVLFSQSSFQLVDFDLVSPSSVFPPKAVAVHSCLRVRPGLTWLGRAS